MIDKTMTSESAEEFGEPAKFVEVAAGTRAVNEQIRDARGVHGAASGNGGSHGAARSYTIYAPCTAQKTVAPRRIRGGKSEGRGEWIVDSGQWIVPDFLCLLRVLVASSRVHCAARGRISRTGRG